MDQACAFQSAAGRASAAAPGAGGQEAPLANGTEVARGLGGGEELPIWFSLDLSGHAGLQGGTLVQCVMYQAQCAPP